MARVPSFSERHGITKAELLKREDMPETLRLRLWTAVYDSRGHRNAPIWPNLFSGLVKTYFTNRTMAECQWAAPHFCDTIQNEFLTMPWNRVYDLLEAIYQHWDAQAVGYGDQKKTKSRNEFETEVNEAFEQYLAAWRMITGRIVEFTTDADVGAVKDALADAAGSGENAIFTHLDSALALFSQRPTPDYRNSIKEAITAVECVCRLLGADEGRGLKDPMKALSEKIHLHKAMETGLAALYGWTSDSGTGIRHPLMDVDGGPGCAEAKYMLVTCSAVVTFLLNKARIAGLIK